ncbi:hypothetical protein ACET3Z_024722 [Daucus carota]
MFCNPFYGAKRKGCGPSVEAIFKNRKKAHAPDKQVLSDSVRVIDSNNGENRCPNLPYDNHRECDHPNVTSVNSSLKRLPHSIYIVEIYAQTF